MKEHEHAIINKSETKPAHDEVAKKGYGIYLKEGRPQGRDVQNWLGVESKMPRAGPEHHRKEITALKLNGKPAPDAFLEAARRVGAEPARAVVVEDADAGVEAGRAGRFGCVIGVDRSGRAQALRDGGADVVVTDLAQVGVAMEPPSAWSLVFESFDPAQAGILETLCTLGNGYFATRGAAAGAVADDVHYPGTYLAGGYNRLRTNIAGRVVESEDLVNFPNWLALEFRIAAQDWFDTRTVKLLSYRQELDLRRGLLLRNISFEDGEGLRSTLKEQRLVSMGAMHLCALELSLTAENWSGSVTVRSAIDGRVREALPQVQ